MKRKSMAERDSMVIYRRTSTDDQVLGIDAQDETGRRIAQQRGCQVVRTFTEHESGGDNERPELGKAMNHARRIGAIVVVAKLDRLARDATFLMSLYDGNVPIIFGDFPEVDGTTAAGRIQIQMMAAMAEFERRRMGERMKDWHRVRKAQGFKAGTPANLTHAARVKGSQVASVNRTAQAIAEMSDVIPIILKLRSDGGTLQAIADHLNAEGYTTRQGGKWSTTPVLRILRRSSAK
jgi:DNA invertase Pin-like site-specific DNA recombinase